MERTNKDLVITREDALALLEVVDYADEMRVALEPNVQAAYEKLDAFVGLRCAWCGERENEEQGPVVDTIIAPPVEGFGDVFPEPFHKDCADRAARELVR